ncbi:hypothetical protein EV421DRAFT_1797655, partial [Armillaria borealis]
MGGAMLTLSSLLMSLASMVCWLGILFSQHWTDFNCVRDVAQCLTFKDLPIVRGELSLEEIRVHQIHHEDKISPIVYGRSAGSLD